MKIPVAKPWIDEKEINYVTEAIKSGWISKGKFLAMFEERFADYLGVKHALAVSSGTAAIEVALRALNTQKKEVLTAASSCAATANAVLHADYKIKFVDINKDSYTIDVKKITKNTGVIMPIHLYGQSCDMDPIIEIAEENGIPIIEDCAQSLGARYKQKLVGCFGKLACFSFYSNKIITTAEGGMITTNDDKLAERIKIIRNHGQAIGKTFYHLLYGYNFKMSNIHAAIGLGQLEKIDEIIKKRRNNAKFLMESLKDIAVKLPTEMPYAYHIYFSFPILLNKKCDEVIKFLHKEGIETRQMFGPMSQQPFYEDMFGKSQKFPVTERIFENGFYVSCSPTLKKEDLLYMATKIKEGVKLVE